MITIELLKNHPNSIPRLVDIWHEGIAKTWLPDACINRVQQQLHEHLNENSLPLTFVAFDGITPIGMCSLRVNDGIRTDLSPWLGSLVVDLNYQKQGIGKMLIDATKNKAQELGFTQLYLFAFDPTIPDYYTSLDWVMIGMDEFKNHPVTIMSVEL
jgi:N-acetylglutamate synthase-like GNAT family acetyltransferase